MNRRNWLITTFAGLAGTGFPTLVAAQVIDGRISLRDRLKAGLRCRRPEEEAFADHIVDLVEQKKLTTEMVLGTLKWAVERRPNFPFYYFRDAIRIRAKSVGVTV